MEKQRNRRSKEERIADIEARIEAHKQNIASLEAKKQAILNPKSRKAAITMNAVLKKAKEQGLSAKEIAKKLNLSLDN